MQQARRRPEAETGAQSESQRVQTTTGLFEGTQAVGDRTGTVGNGQFGGGGRVHTEGRAGAHARRVRGPERRGRKAAQPYSDPQQREEVQAGVPRGGPRANLRAVGEVARASRRAASRRQCA
jgi:hypothetical protein